MKIKSAPVRPFFCCLISPKKSAFKSPITPLPEPLAYSSAILEQDFIYVVGGKNDKESVNLFYRMSLSGVPKWEKLDDFPGAPRALHVSAVQETQAVRRLFVIGGRNQIAGKKSETPTSYLSYNLKEGLWKNEGDLLIDGKPRGVMGAAMGAVGSMHLLLFGVTSCFIFGYLFSLIFRDKN